MTGQEAMNIALALLAEEGADEYLNMTIRCINQILMDLMYLLPDVNVIPKINSLSDVLPIPEKLARMCVPYGLCVLYALSDDENTKASYFELQYKEAQAAFLNSEPATITKVVDVYATNEE